MKNIENLAPNPAGLANGFRNEKPKPLIDYGNAVEDVIPEEQKSRDNTIWYEYGCV